MPDTHSATANIPVKVTPLPFRILDGRAVIIQPRRSEVHEFNETGTFIWNLIDGLKTPETIAEALVKEFDISTAEVKQDVEEFLAELKTAGLIELVEVIQPIQNTTA